MTKATFKDFITQNPNCKKFDGNPDALNIFDLLSRDENIIAMIDANTAGRPALTPCARAVEEYVDGQNNPTISLADDFTKQAVGRMVKTILAPFGYTPARQKDLPKEIHAQYFTSATCYEIDASTTPTMAVERRLTEI